MTITATQEMADVFKVCSEDSLPDKENNLIKLASQLICCDCSGAKGSIEKAKAAGASEDEILCVACHSTCTGGAYVQSNFLGLGVLETKRENLCNVSNSLDKKTSHLIALAACLTASCDCAAGHIVEARNAGANEAEIARAACLAACTCGCRVTWRFAEAIECAKDKSACACEASC